MPKALLFIPDISGYTRFINNTEISHQQHIITELLEILIDTNDIGLELAEIEGDALFMYKTENIPSTAEILSLVKRMFIKFHAHLKYYDKYRICHCGACEGATGLNLKFVMHEGEVSFLKIKDFKPKPQGKEVILVHRLLKNDIKSQEYLLMSEKINDLQPEEITSVIGSKSLMSSSQDYGSGDIGLVNYQYTDLGHLKSSIDDPEALRPSHISSNPLTVSTTIDIVPVDLFEILINFEHRLKWNDDVDSMTYNEKEINQSGSQHICIIQGKEIEFETVKGPERPGVWSFGEVSKAPIIGEVYVYFLISQEGDRSNLQVEVHPNPSNLIGKIMLPLFNFKFKSILKDTISKIKTYAESI